MILSLHIRHIALIDDLTISFSQGMHVLTGETGAGKSIVVDAVNLVLGGRADRDLIRTGEEKAQVEAVFDAADSPAVAAFLAEREIEQEGLVTLSREISRSGRGLCRICGTVMPVSALRELADLLMDVHGQHEANFLMDSRYHLRFLDATGDEAHQRLLAETEEACAAFLACHRHYGRLVREHERRDFRMEQLKKSLEELRRAKLKAGEEETLKQEQERGRHMEKISSALREAYSRVSAGEGFSALPVLKPAIPALQAIEELDPAYKALSTRLASAYYELEEVGYELAGMIDASDFDSARAEQVESRLDLIRRLERKYGEDIPAVLSAQEAMETELEGLASMDQQLAELAAEDRRLLAAYRTVSARLSASRRELAAAFEQGMMTQLRELGMERTVFSVAFSRAGDGHPVLPQPEGDDLVEFQISPNPGEPLKPLSRIASGGELSRIMLALKTMEADRGGVGCMVFDEIDTGISGRMAQVVAEKMAGIARNRQVICVTHLPQIAAMAAHAYLVEKQVNDGRTSTSVRLLDEDGRAAELARMLFGADGSSDSALLHARHMLRSAEEFRAGGSARGTD